MTLCLQVIPGDSRRFVAEIFTLDGEYGHGYTNDLISERLARELGCVLRHTPCHEYSYLTSHPLSVKAVTKLKVRIRGPFVCYPYWLLIDAIVIHDLEHLGIYGTDLILSWVSQHKYVLKPIESRPQIFLKA